ncbi:MAG: DMT family transporter [Alphaproteobacteria bacterium]|nr:DMT family transporter [Alphaproteobacteria bacterium]
MSEPLPGLRRWIVNPYVVLTLSMLVGSGTLVVGRGAVGEIPPIALTFWRWAVAVAVLIPIGIGPLLRQRRVLLRHWLLLLGMGATACSSHHVFLFYGLESTTAINASIQIGGMPVATVALAVLLTRERVDWRVLAGMALGFAGVGLVIARGDPAALLRLEINTGDALVMAAVWSWAAYCVMLGRLPHGIDGRGLLLAMAVIGLVILTPLYIAELASGDHMVISTATVLSILYVGIFPSVIGNMLWQYGVRLLGPSRASQFTYLGPIFSATWAFALLDETLAPYHAALLLIFLGIYLATRAPRRAVE